MALVNIRRDVDDQFYRYKMEVLQGKVEGKGNGIKTVIVNLPNIARDLDRQPEYITKFFEIEFNTKSNIEHEKYSINGQHPVDRLATILDKFISKYVLCSFCKNPETKLVIKKGVIEFKCAACGKIGPIDMRHKLSSYIVKNPPKAVSTKSTHDEALAQQPQTIKKEKKSSKKKKEEDEEDDDEVWFTDTSEKAAEERRKFAMGETTSAVVSMMADLSIEGNGNGTTNEDDEQQKEDVNQEEDVQEQEDEEDVSPEVSSISAFLKSNPTDQQLMEKLDAVQEEFGLRSSAVAKAAIEALGKNAENTVKFVKSQSALIKKISKRRDGKMGILLGLEEICVRDETLLKSIQGILKTFYDSGILTEENITKWYHQKAKSKVVIKACSQFIEWLENAEEEENEEDEE